MRKISDSLFLFFLFILPFQTVYLLREPMIGGEKWQYGTIGIYASSLVLAIAILIVAISREKEIQNISIGIRMETLWRERKTDAFLLLFVLWSGLSLLWAQDAMLAMYSFCKILLVADAFVMTRDMVRRGKLRQVISVLLLAVVIQAGIGIGQFLMQESFRSSLLGTSAYESWQAGTSVLKNDTGRFLRAYGTFPHPNIYGLFLAVGLLLVAHRIMSMTRGAEQTIERVVTVGVVPVILLGLILSFSRSAWAGFAIGFAFLMAQTIISGGRHIRMRLYATISVVVLSSVIFSFILREAVFPRFDQATVGQERSVTDRMTTYRDALGIICVHPLLGVGVGNMTAELIRLRPEQPLWDIQPAHDVPLLICSELGIPGLVLSLCFFGSLALPWLRKKNVPTLAGTFLVFLPSLLLDHFLWDSNFGLLFLFVALGITTSDD